MYLIYVATAAKYQIPVLVCIIGESVLQCEPRDKNKQEPQDVARHKPYLSSFVQYAHTSINELDGNSMDNSNMVTLSMEPRKQIITIQLQQL